MREKICGLLLALAFAFSALFSPVAVYATETNTAATEKEKEPTEMEINYAKPIASNKIDGWPKGPKVYAKAAIVMDIDTGAVLYEKNVDEALYPASITKIMTTLLAIENSTPDELVTFSSNAINSLPWDCSRVGARPDEVFTMEDCLYAMMLSSANEVCIGVAEHIAGSEEAFCDMMNERAKALGCTNTHFVNCNGMPDEKHVISARDMALIAAEAFKNPLFRKVSGSIRYVIPMTNKAGELRYCSQHHKMLKENSEFYYQYAAGGKTGYTRAALNTLVTYATKDDRNLVCVTLRTNGTQQYLDTAKLLDYGFNEFTCLTVYEDDPIDNLQYPAQFFGLLPDTKEHTPCQVTVPNGVDASALSFTGTAAANTITRTYTWHDALVGQFQVPASDFFNAISDPNSFASLSAKETPSLLKSSHAKSKLENVMEKHVSSNTILTKLAHNLTGWQRGLCGVLVVAIILYIVILIRTIVRAIQKRKRKKRKARRRAQQANRTKKAKKK